MNILDTPLLPINIFLRSSEYTTNNNTTKYKSNLLFELNKTILSFSNMDTIIKLESFQFTNSFYTINENNCNLYITFLNDSTISTVTFNLGNYTIDSLITELKNSLYNTLSFGDFNVSYNPLTYKITLNNDEPFKLLSGPCNIYEIIGFDDYGMDNYTLAGDTVAPYLFNLMGVQVLHICINNINLNSYGLKNKSKYNIIASIHVIVPSGETQTFYNGFEYQIGYEPLTSLNITIYDQDFNIVNFNNIDWFLNLSFKFVYKKMLTIPDFLDTTDGETSMGYYLQEEEKKNINNFIDTIIKKLKK